jgi:uncharacterized SAM-binding protein YcdF (DUF218 family)
VIAGSRRARAAAVLVTVVLLLVAAVWFARESILAGAGAVLVVEDRIAPADIIVVSNSLPRATAFEAAVLYQQHVGRRIVMTDWVADPLADKVRALGIPYLTPAEMSRMVLEKSGVAPAAITMLSDRVDGTGSEISAIAAFIERERPASVLFITARSHTARTRWLLRRALPGRVNVTVRSSRFDPFPAAGWWHDRENTREVMTEYLRWFNTLYLPDMWSRPIASARLGAL